MEALRLFAGCHLVDFLCRRRAGSVRIAHKFHVPAERQQTEFPPRAVTIVNPEELRAKSDGENLYAYVVGSGDQIMSKLVEENHRSDHRKERPNIV